MSKREFLSFLEFEKSLSLAFVNSNKSRHRKYAQNKVSTHLLAIMPWFLPRMRRKPYRKRPFALRFRSSIYYIALVASMGLLTDVCLFPLFTPAIPFRLESLGFRSVPSLTGWLSAGYAGGLIISTLPFIWLGSRYKAKRNILLAALLLMAGGVLIFLLVPYYAAMVAARVLQGGSGAGIWTLGLALGAQERGGQAHR